MSRYTYSSKHPTDDSNKKYEDPGRNKLSVLEKSSNHKSEQYVDGPILLATEYKFIVQTKVEPFKQPHSPTPFMFGQQRRTPLPISEAIEKPVLGANKKDHPSSPINDHKLNLPIKVETKHTGQSKVDPSNPAHGPMQYTLGQQRRTPLPISEPIEKPVLGPNKKDHPSSPIHDQKLNLPIKVETKHTGQSKVEPSNPAHGPMQYTLGQQRRTPLPISDPIEKPVLGPNKRDQPSSPIHNDKLNLPMKVEDKHTVQTKVEPSNNKKEKYPSNPVHNQTYSLPTKNHRVVDEKQDKPSTRVHDYGFKSPIKGVETKNSKPLDNKWGKAIEPVHDYPAEESRPTEPGFMSGNNWQQIGGKQDLEKPNIDTGRYERYVGWGGPNKGEWVLPPSQATPLFGVTNNIGEALNNLELIKSAPPPPNNFNYMDSKNLISDTNSGVIDSREAERKYANQKPSARTSVNYIGTINNIEAAKKYGGTRV